MSIILHKNKEDNEGRCDGGGVRKAVVVVAWGRQAVWAGVVIAGDALPVLPQELQWGGQEALENLYQVKALASIKPNQ